MEISRKTYTQIVKILKQEDVEDAIGVAEEICSLIENEPISEIPTPPIHTTNTINQEEIYKTAEMAKNPNIQATVAARRIRRTDMLMKANNAPANAYDDPSGMVKSNTYRTSSKNN